MGPAPLGSHGAPASPDSCWSRFPWGSRANRDQPPSGPSLPHSPGTRGASRPPPFIGPTSRSPRLRGRGGRAREPHDTPPTALPPHASRLVLARPLPPGISRTRSGGSPRRAPRHPLHLGYPRYGCLGRTPMIPVPLQLRLEWRLAGSFVHHSGTIGVPASHDTRWSRFPCNYILNDAWQGH